MVFKARVTLLAFALATLATSAQARGGLPAEEPWNPEHIRELPSEVQSAILKVCGPTAHAEHYFATYLDQPRRIRLHFEHAHCAHDQGICNPSGCLHQEYLLSGGHYRLLKSYYGPSND